MKIFHNIYPKIITLENIFAGYDEFRRDKLNKKDVIKFERNREDNLFELYKNLKDKTYQPGKYTGFYITDPKQRLIHKASVIDRIVHHIVGRELETIFEPIFYAHSYSCRKNKGTHRGVLALQAMARGASKNNTNVCWSVKCDIRKFFGSVNHRIIKHILSEKIGDSDFMNLLVKIIDSFYSDQTINLEDKKGIPIGNLTSQFFSNIYMNKLDQFIKYILKIKYYARYADDFVMLSTDKKYLENIIPKVKLFLKQELDLELHPQKIIFRKYNCGIDFLGYIIFPHHILPRTKTKRRLLKKIRRKIRDYKEKKISSETLYQIIQSYLGYLGHAKSFKFKRELLNKIWFWMTE